MATNLQLSASVSGGTLNINFFRTDDNVLLDSLSLSDGNPAGQLDTPLEDGKNYSIIYNVKAKKEGCVYKFDVTSPAPAQAHIVLTLHKGDTDFNAIPFHT